MNPLAVLKKFYQKIKSKLYLKHFFSSPPLLRYLTSLANSAELKLSFNSIPPITDFRKFLGAQNI